MCNALRRVKKRITICWLSSFIVALPQLFIFRESNINGRILCASTGYTAEWQRRVYFTIFSCYLLIIPAISITIWYIKIIYVISSSSRALKKSLHHGSSIFLSKPIASPTKIRTVQLAMTIIIVFVACWTPYIVVTLVEIYSSNRIRMPSWLDGVIQMICLLQSGLNPFIFIIFNQRRKMTSVTMTSAEGSFQRRSHGYKRNTATISSFRDRTSFQLQSCPSSSSTFMAFPQRTSI